jgi:hypothetical protein
MTPQTPAEGILLHRDYGNAKVYTITCECTDPACSHSTWIECEADDYSVTVTTYTEQKTAFWSASRWKTMWRLLTRGYVEYSGTIILREQQALNYAATLTSAIEDVKLFRQQAKENRLKQNSTVNP